MVSGDTNFRNGDNRDRNGHVLVWEQAGLDDNDGQSRKEPGFFKKTRHFVTLMLFFGMANAYIMRTNMSIAIVAMVDPNYIEKKVNVTNECPNLPLMNNHTDNNMPKGNYKWDHKTQSWVQSSFFWGYVLTQIPFGMLAKEYGSKYFLGIGMLINSLAALLVPWSADKGYLELMIVRFIQGLGEGPIVPCTHAMLAKWIPPNERSRMGAWVYAGAQFGSVVSLPLSGLLARYGFAGGWPSIFYVFGIVGAVWCIAFLYWVSEDPEKHPTINSAEKKYILSSVWGNAESISPPAPYKSILKSWPFWAILIAHMGHNYGYETIITQLPTFMNQILRFDIKTNGLTSALPPLAMWIFSTFISFIADYMISNGHWNHTLTRKIANSIGLYGPALFFMAASYTGCNPPITVAFITLGLGLNGGIYSGFKVNHLDISPRFAGILMSLTNCLANLCGLLAPIAAPWIIGNHPSLEKWRWVFAVCAAFYFFGATFYNIFGSGVRQTWDNPDDDKKNKDEKNIELQEKNYESSEQNNDNQNTEAITIDN